ncbi:MULTISPECIES: cupredoxin family copper-binding protein [unclassified Streptomyces]|uniref:cupredoxin domain-containing protein n=1 Tax=unclassified Streptomyces TaxID=2593676 RepID=UPI00364644F9
MSFTRTRAAAVGAACALFAVVGVTSTSAAPASPPSVASSVTAETTEVHIKDFKFNPSTLTVKPGTKVTVVNEDSTPHSLTASDGSFDTGSIAAGASGSFTAPSGLGTYPFVCSFHPQMTGTLTVR